MGTPAFWDDSRRAQDLVRERSELSRTVAQFRELLTHAQDLGVLLELAAETGDESVTPEIEEGVARARRALDDFELKIMLGGPHDVKDAIVSIHPGAGGTESQDWAQILMRMYLRWCERGGFKAEVVDLQPGEEAGIKSQGGNSGRSWASSPVRRRRSRSGARSGPTRSIPTSSSRTIARASRSATWRP